MFGESKCSFFTQIGRKFFNWRLNREIFANLFPHLRHESDEGYVFKSDDEMNACVEELDVRKQLESVEKQIAKLPNAYGLCFRYIMHRDIHERLRMYSEMAARRTPREIDTQFVARRSC